MPSEKICPQCLRAEAERLVEGLPRPPAKWSIEPDLPPSAVLTDEQKALVRRLVEISRGQGPTWRAIDGCTEHACCIEWREIEVKLGLREEGNA